MKRARIRSKYLVRSIRHRLMKTSLEQLLCLGFKSELPQRQLMAVYVGYSIIGTLLLLLPTASVGNVSLIDHIFTAVSAVSTTGMTTVNVAKEYTFFGQVIILFLIQMGGLGYMTLSSYVMVKITGRFGTQKAKLLNAQFAFPDTLDAESMLRSIVKYTFLFEILGFALLCPYFIQANVSQPVWSALFHSISAFCTAGFSIYPDNLMQFQTDGYVNIVIMLLSISGAMGFIFMTDISRLFTRRKHRITFTSKVILTITGGLALWGTLHLILCEDSFRNMPIDDRILISAFQSISAMTTVGFNTVDISQITHISMLILTMTMYIGASPSGTGGGLKSTTLSAIYAYTLNKLGLHDKVSLRGNIIPDYRVDTALTTTLFYTFILFVGIYLIGLFEPDNADYLKLSFEATAALATAGMSAGELSYITVGSKVVLIFLMYIGRVGVITFGNALLIRPNHNPTTSPNDIAV